MSLFSTKVLNSSVDGFVVALSGRIDTSNAQELESTLMDMCADYPSASLTIDAADLAYISSAGLRVFMRLRKELGGMSVINVSTDVYEILSMTGFTELLDVRRALREVSVEGCELLGSGANGDVYRLQKDEMVKVFRPTLTFEDIEAERVASRQAFVLGVPCAISFDTVRCGDSLGTVYEALDAKTIVECIREDPSTLERYATLSAEMLKKLHAIEVPEGQLPPADACQHARIDTLADDFSAEELETLHGLIDALPPMGRFVHNDYHPKNVMVSDGELMIIDLGEAGIGNPLLDVMHTYFIFNLIGAGTGTHKADELSFIGITYGELEAYWKVFLPAYCASQEKADRLNDLLAPWGWMLYLFSAMSHPLLPKEYHASYAERMRQHALSHAETMASNIEEMVTLCGLSD